jgi:hypothetical protein
MKLSNKILLGFFGIIFLYLTAAFTEVRMTGLPNFINDKNSVRETVDLSGIHYLVLNDVDKQIRVIGSDSTQLEARSLSGGILAKLSYKISNDTLTISGFQSDDIETTRISVLIPGNALRGINVKSAVANIDGIVVDALQISQTSGTIWMSESKIGKIDADLAQSYLDVSRSDIDTLSGTFARSQVSVYSSVGLMRGSLKEGTVLRLSGVSEMQLKKDESSRLYMLQ